MRARLSVTAPLVAVVLLCVTASHTAADGSWLDSALVSWNAAGMDVPAAPTESALGGPPPYCERYVRPAETAEDVQVAQRGWLLASPYQLGWGISVVQGFLDFDAMCRPVSYQHFVFVDGVFAGTLAPDPMLPRIDGALVNVWIEPDAVGATYGRYAPGDGLCCPSSQTWVSFAVERTGAGTVVTPTHADDVPAPAPGR